MDSSGLPKLTTLASATVQKIINEVLASKATDENAQSMSFAKETRDLLIECCVEFITMISTEANEIAEKDAKKTIACEHITKALEELGFGEYVQEIMAVADQFKTSQVVRITLLPLLHEEVAGNTANNNIRSPERRSRAKWNKAACHPKSWPGCKKSSSAQRAINSTLLRRSLPS